jgi:hypothetical protein
MIARLKAAASRNDATLAEDCLGVAVLFVLLFAALALPGAA